MKDAVLKNGTKVLIRTAIIEDAQNVIDFYNFIGGETDFLSFGKNEFPMNLVSEGNHIETMSKENNSIMILALLNKEIIGIMTLNSSQKSRMKHVGVLGVGIKQAYCGLGLGNILMEEVIDFAKNNGITKKITLITRQDNYKAIKLYEKMGFEVEGIFKKDNIEKGVYYDSIYMSLFL